MSDIFDVVRRGDIKTLRTFYTDWSVLNSVDKHGQTPLHIAAYEGHLHIVRGLISQKVSVNVLDTTCCNPLLLAASNTQRTDDHLIICEVLLRAGTNPNALTDRGTSVFHYLARFPYSEKLAQVLQLLQEKGGDIDVVDDIGETPLHQAAFRGVVETCQFLVKAGAGLNVPNKFGETPLHSAARSGKAVVVALLLSFGADPFVEGDNGTPSEVAFMSNHQEVVDIFQDFNSSSSSSSDDIVEQRLPDLTSSQKARKRADPRYRLTLELQQLPPSFTTRQASFPSTSVTGNKLDGYEVFGIHYDPNREEEEEAQDASEGRGRTDSILRRAPSTDPNKSFILPDPQWNMELGSKSYEISTTNDMSLEYTDEHDDYFFTMHFLKEPDEYFKCKSSANLSKIDFKDHVHVIGIQDEAQVIISLRKDLEDGSFVGLLRTRSGDKAFCLYPAELGSKKEVKILTEKLCMIGLKNKYPTLEQMVVVEDIALSKSLLDIDQLLKVQRYKFGVVYCRGKQTEEEIFSNDYYSSHFENFMDLLGTKIQLEGWTGYKGDLDIKRNATGTHSYYSTWKHFEIMFHISQFVPQKERRKALIGNTICTIIFQESGTFDPSLIRSQVLHCFLIVQPVLMKDGSILYRLGTVSKKGVPRFRPSLPYPSIHQPNETFRDLIFYKLINGERAAYHCSSKVRTQNRSLVEIVQHTRTGQMDHCIKKSTVASKALSKPSKEHTNSLKGIWKGAQKVASFGHGSTIERNPNRQSKAPENQPTQTQTVPS